MQAISAVSVWILVVSDCLALFESPGLTNPKPLWTPCSRFLCLQAESSEGVRLDICINTGKPLPQTPACCLCALPYSMLLCGVRCMLECAICHLLTGLATAASVVCS
jgi:hypothetical protein